MTAGRHDTKLMKKLIGSRLQAARGKISRQKLTDRLNRREDRPVIGGEKGTLSVETLKKWEYGENPINIEWLPLICDVLDCDIGYLFGMYPDKRREVSDICSITGLSTAAVNTIIGDQHDGFRDDRLEALNFLLTSPNFENALLELVRFKEAEREAAIFECARKKDISNLKDISEYRPNISLLGLIDDTRKTATLCEYNLSKSFTFVIEELKRTVDEDVLKSANIQEKGGLSNGKEK